MDDSNIKKAIFGISRHRMSIDGKGITTLVAFMGCPLRCKYCLNDPCHAPLFENDGTFILGYIPRKDNEALATMLDMGWEEMFETEISELKEHVPFSRPTRNVELPTLPKNVDAAIGANGKPVVIKKNIFEKNNKSHKDLSPQQSREILSEALYSPNLYEQNQKTTRPYNWILVHNAAKHSSVILEVAHSKDNIEIVNWHYLDDATLKQKERQAIKEGGLILTLESAAGNTHDDLSSEDKGTDNSEDKQEDKTENEVERRLKIEIDKVTDTPQFGKRLTHSWQVSYNSGELTREQLLRLEKKAQKMGGSYDSDMDTFNMPTEETANQMKETIIKEAMVNDDSQRSAHENETILDKANRIADEQKKKREAKKAESEEKKPTFVIKPSTYTNKAGKND